MVKIIFIGDIVGRAGRRILKKLLPSLKDGNEPCFTVVNAENAAGGFGLTQKVYDELIDMGVDLLTGGNHIWDKNEVLQNIEHFPKLVFPANLSKSETLNRNFAATLDFSGIPLAIVNLVGKVFMPQGNKDPFQAFDKIYAAEKLENRVVILDFHAEATSEKIALAEYAGARIAAVIGTHTHVQTSDERILRNGAFFITDAGSCSAVDSILGMTVATSLGRFTGSPNQKMEVELNGPHMINGVELLIDPENRRVARFKRINIVSEL